MSGGGEGGRGLTTAEALLRLKDDIAEHLSAYETSKSNRLKTFKCLHLSNPNSVIGWPSLCISFFFGLALYVAFIILYAKESNYFLFFQATLIFVIGFLIIGLIYNEERLIRKEIPDRVKHSLVELERAAAECDWSEKNYPHLCAPFSPCVTLQWTYRDGKIVNLPWALLARGDIIVMRPGQESPGHCIAIDDSHFEIHPRQIYQPSTLNKEKFTTPRAINPHKSRLFRIKTTPFLLNLQLALDEALNRPVTIYNKQRHRVTIEFIEVFLLPMIIIVCLVAIFVRHFYLNDLIGSTHWTKAFILQLIATTLPLLPNMFPIAWIALNIYGMAKFKYLLNRTLTKKNSNNDELSESLENPLLSPVENSRHSFENSSIWQTFWRISIGRENFISRSANIVHVLGSVTALCCVDKKGILSWPNPTAEKVFFFRNQTDINDISIKNSMDESTTQLNEKDQESVIEKPTKPLTALNNNNPTNITTIAEVLDLTHDQNIPFKLDFDDNLWKNHISSLKPLGLAILVNTCNMNTQEHYAHFCAHLTCEATQTEDTVPVTNRRCLCELAKQIGFSDEAKNIYSLQNHIATFRHLQPDIVRRDTKFARSLHLSSRVKVPFPHMLGVVIKDQTGGLQLMTQGTADIILDSCVEYWNGQNLCIFSPTDRKKVLDFYQRSSLTAYCSAFAYRPLNRGVTNTLASMYIELPADCRNLFPAIPSWSEPLPPITTHYHSTDSLLFSDMNDEDVNDIDGCFDLQCNQIFIGMVTMQYQAQSDMVELIERLDRACIRFVHFSKENELRSRVFSEKMGLESGWNCHISLSSENDRPASPTTSQNLPTPSCSEKCWKTNQTDKNNSRDGENVIVISSLEASKPLSNSAPGAINLEHTTVKFYNETGHVRYDTRNNSIIQQNPPSNESDLGESQDSVLLGGWEEGDHSPADGCRSLSCLTDSTDHSAPVNFDMRNRAKLPRGIENIRPHIEQVDNVPLLVSLFTDCTANTARRMISIMQDYKEVVCVMGSAANKDNMEIFMQADASIAVEPLYPVLCQKVPPYVQPKSSIGPVDLARILNSIPCSISINKEDNLSLFSLVTMARHYMMCLWSASQFWLCSLCCLTLIQVMSILLALPIIFSIGNVMWLSFVVIPLISMSLASSEIDPSVMGRATNKHQEVVDRKLCFYVLWCYGYKFLPSAICILVYFGTMLRTYCENYIIPKNNGTICTWVYPNNGYHIFNTPNNINYSLSSEVDSVYSSNELIKYSLDPPDLEWKGWGDVYSEGYVITQDMCLILMTLLLVTISVSFVHREYSLWQRNIFSNKLWVVSILLVFIIQISYTCLSLVAQHNTEIKKGHLVFDFPFLQLIWLCATPPIILSINEFIKMQEIKANKRYQRRARLDFGTKLGMNSPF